MSALNLLTILILITLITTLIFRHIRIPAILGYIVVGILIGPYILNWLQNEQTVHDIAEFGIVFLMFTIGLEFSFRQLQAMRRIVLGFGGLQVLLSALTTFFIALWLDISIPAAIIIGGVVAMSSTAIVLKQLTEQTELYSSHGTNAVGILLLQDLAVIPFLVLISKLGTATETPFAVDFGIALGKSVFLIFTIMITGRFIMRPLFQKTAATTSPELFTLMTLAAATSFAWLSHSLGLSLSLGAFLAGMMLSESQFRHQIMIEIRPFRDILLGLFFITIGMRLNIYMIVDAWPWMALLITALIAFKISLITALGLFFKNTISTSLRTGLILAQGGEFGLVLLFEGLKSELLPPDYGQVILGAILMSMVLSPILINFNQQITAWLFPKKFNDEQQTLKEIQQFRNQLTNHAIICGFGRVGQNIAALLATESLPYIAIDLDADRVNQALTAGKHVIYGDACRLDILRSVGIKTAKCLVICLDDSATIIKLLQQINNIHPQILILVRCHSGTDIETYQQLGANEIIPETLESSLVLGSHLLLHMGIPATKVFSEIEATRHNRYALFKHVFSGYQWQDMKQEIATDKQLVHLTITKSSPLIHHTLQNFAAGYITIVALRRNGINLTESQLLATKIQEGDVIVVYGSSADICKFKQSHTANKT